MGGKKLLAAFLLSVGLCFMPALGHGEVLLGPKITVGEGLIYEKNPLWPEVKVMYTNIILLHARVNYIMKNPTNFLQVDFYYDPDGRFEYDFPEGVNTKGKIYVTIYDNRNAFIGELTVALLEQFKVALEVLYTYISIVATDMNTDIVAKFYSKGEIPLGYFYQGEYHLWGE